MTCGSFSELLWYRLIIGALLLRAKVDFQNFWVVSSPRKRMGIFRGNQGMLGGSSTNRNWSVALGLVSKSL